MQRGGSHFAVTGSVSSRGLRYIKIETDFTTAYVPHRMLGSNEQEAKSFVAAQGVIAGPYWRQMIEEASRVTDFDSARLADRAGWNGDLFALQSGEILAPEGEFVPDVVFPTDADRSAQSGSLAGWRDGVAVLLSGQSLPMVVILIALSGALVELVGNRENPGVALFGGAGSGKSTLLDLAQGLSSRPRSSTFNITIDGLESEMVNFNGQALIRDELNLFYGDDNAARRGTRQKLAAFRLADGTIKKRWAPTKTERYTFSWLTATNEPIGALMTAEADEVVKATSDRMITLSIPPDKEYQTFDFVPEGYGNIGMFAKALQQNAAVHYGHAFPAFVQGLVNDLAEDREGTIERLRSDVERWCLRVGVDGGDGSQGRVGEAFGLFYAAGEHAKRHHVLPADWMCGHAVETVYHELYVGSKPTICIDDAIRSYLLQPGVRNLDTEGMRPMGAGLLARTPAFLKVNRKGQLEAIIPPLRAATDLPDLRLRLASSKVGLKLNCEAGRYDNKREVRRNHGLERMVVLTLPQGFLEAA